MFKSNKFGTYFPVISGNARIIHKFTIWFTKLSGKYKTKKNIQKKLPIISLNIIVVLHLICYFIYYQKNVGKYASSGTVIGILHRKQN
jgi:RsiW-degrading membrane proteinase PrsW (M82 family)